MQRSKLMLQNEHQFPIQCDLFAPFPSATASKKHQFLGFICRANRVFFFVYAWCFLHHLYANCSFQRYPFSQMPDFAVFIIIEFLAQAHQTAVNWKNLEWRCPDHRKFSSMIRHLDSDSSHSAYQSDSSWCGVPIIVSKRFKNCGVLNRGEKGIYCLGFL